MPTETKLADLEAMAARVEALSAPDREVDAKIWYLCVEKPQTGDKLDRDIRHKWPAYTASLDAAMTLVPEGHLFTVRILWDGRPTCGYSIVTRYTDDRSMSDGWRYENQFSSIGQTPALALCAAAIRALAKGDV